MTPRFTRRAEAQFFAALAHIHAANPAAGVAFRHRAESGLERLGPFPRSGRRLAECQGEAVILAVWHSAQQPARPKRG